jgi:hypothetical protein
VGISSGQPRSLASTRARSTAFSGRGRMALNQNAKRRMPNVTRPLRARHADLRSLAPYETDPVATPFHLGERCPVELEVVSEPLVYCGTRRERRARLCLSGTLRKARAGSAQGRQP